MLALKQRLEALDAGALDFLPKKFNEIAKNTEDAGSLLRQRVVQLARKKAGVDYQEYQHFVHELVLKINIKRPVWFLNQLKKLQQSAYRRALIKVLENSTNYWRSAPQPVAQLHYKKYLLNYLKIFPYLLSWYSICQQLLPWLLLTV